MTKYCKDCIHYNSGWVGENLVGEETCDRPIPCLISKERPLRKHPYSQRLGGECGQEALFFLPIPSSILNKFFK